MLHYMGQEERIYLENPESNVVAIYQNRDTYISPFKTSDVHHYNLLSEKLK